MGTDFIDLPFAIQIALGSGYIAYLIAYSGIRQHHTTTDVIFRSMAFGLVATAIFQAPWLGDRWLAGLAFGATVTSGAFWRRFGMKWSKQILRASDVSWSDDIPSAWLTLIASDTNASHSQITVDLHDGRMLHCSDTRRFKDAPHGPCIYGLDGSIAMYVTTEIRPNGETIEHENVFDNHEGWQITFIPSNSIKRADIRLQTRKSAKSGEDKESDNQ